MTANSRKLTQKQGAFTVLTFKTNEPTQSYLAIYKCKSKGVAAACATRLLKNANIQARLVELHQQVLDDSIATVQERKQILTKIVRQFAFAQVQRNIIAASDQINKMDGSYAPEKKELTGKDGAELIPPTVEYHFADGTITRPHRNGHREITEVLVIDSDGNPEG
ncbi:MAG: terminase small subunit [Candidatus Peribacteraceae bacterium]|nr:terminase small subunit [Candidatus Peribacteraceae bacterium]